MKFFLSFIILIASIFCHAQNNVDIIKYWYKIELNDRNDSIKGEADILGTTPKACTEFSIDLKHIEGNKGMRITALTGLPESFVHIGDKIIVRFQYPNRKNDSFRIKVYYTGVPSDGLIISKNKYGDRTFFADNWPNRAHNWIPCNDDPSDKASFEFIVSAPSHYNVISNGVKLEEKEESNGMKLTHWKEDTPLPTKVMVIGVAKFATKIYEDSPPNIPISAWVYPQDSTKGFYDYAITTDIVKFFSDYIAPFPYKKLANVQSKTIFGGMENASCIFYAENSITGDRSEEDLYAHEIAHQWFGDMASEKSFAHLWLSEGFATYFTDLYFEHKYGKEVMNKRLQKERAEVIEFAKTSTHAVVDSTTNLMSLLNANSYQKGAWVLHMLRQEVGDTVFQKIIQAYYNQYKGGNADTRDFEAVAEKVSGKDLKWFFDQWLYREGIPQLDFSLKKQSKSIMLTIKQKQKKLFSFPLKISYVFDLGRIKMSKTIVVNSGVTNIELPLSTLKVYTGVSEILCDGAQEINTK